MTVIELIEILQTLPADSPVVMSDAEWMDYPEARHVREVGLAASKSVGGRRLDHEFRDGEYIEWRYRPSEAPVRAVVIE